MAKSLLSIREVTKNFAEVEALQGISLEIYSGEIVGLVGSNGAGKTPLLRLMAGNIGFNVKTIVPHFCDIWHCFLNTCNETFCIVFHPLLLSSLCPEEAKTALIAEETVKGSILLH